MKKIFIIIVLCFSTFVSFAQITCTLKGKVVDRPESEILLLNKIYGNEHASSSNSSNKIEIKDGMFEHTFTATEPEFYKLTFEDEIKNGTWASINFCAIDGVVEFELYPIDDRSKNIVSGGKENMLMGYSVKMEMNLYDSLYTPWTDKLDEISEENYYNQLGKDILAQLDTAKGMARNNLYELWYSKQGTYEVYAPNVAQLRRNADNAALIVDKLFYEYDIANPCLYNYALLVSTLAQYKSFEGRYKGEGTAIDYLKKKYEMYSLVYPNHSYTKKCEGMIAALYSIRVGGKYIDFSAPDLDGNMVVLSDEIKGKIAVIDMWGSWCGPCRSASKSFIPLYNEFKDNGFTIVGIARESDSDESMRIAIEKDGYKWLNLIELDDKGGIWEKYGISNAAGGVYLVDKDGTILIIDPKAEEIRKILEEKCK